MASCPQAGPAELNTGNVLTVSTVFSLKLTCGGQRQRRGRWFISGVIIDLAVLSQVCQSELVVFMNDVLFVSATVCAL